MERLGAKRFTGPRALAAEGAFFIAGIAAACNPSPATETQKPTSLPTESPTPTMTIAPTETPVFTATPAPTPEATPTPEPTPEPKSINDLIGVEHKPVKAAKIKDTITNVYEQYSEAESSYPMGPSNFGECSDKNQRISDREATCVIAINNFYGLYKETGSKDFYNLALDVYNYAASQLPQRNMDSIDQYLKENN